jgi:4'-phosphopantetheinyl transferase
MLHVSWLLQRVSDVPEGDAWLSPSEREVLARLWAPKRVRDWRLGRWTGKRALARAGVGNLSEMDQASLARVSIRANESGIPCVFLDDREAEWIISLSHAGECGACAVARPPAALGCDIEIIGRRGEEFVLDWFTDAERRRVEGMPGDRRSRAVTLVWSAKESALKALGVGLRLDTREVEVEVTPDGEGDGGWSPLVVRTPGRVWHGWWRADAECVLTVVADPAPALPVALSPEPRQP